MKRVPSGQQLPDGPLVSIILPVFNGEPFVAEAVRSLLGQTYRNFELIIIDDGSTDSTLQVLQRFADADHRIRLVTRPNKGLVATLNEGLEMASGELIARMDADDISHPLRIERQVAYMCANPDVVLLGVRTYKIASHRWQHRIREGSRFWTWMLLFSNRIGHPGVMFRREPLVAGHLRYDPTFCYVEDYRLWCQLMRFGNADVLPQPLLFYRRHDAALSVLNAELQHKRDRLVSADCARERLGIDLSDAMTQSQGQWLSTLRHRIFSAATFKALPLEDRIAIHLAYQEFAVDAGVAALFDYVSLVGWRPLTWSGLSMPIYFYRVLKHTIRRKLAKSTAV